MGFLAFLVIGSISGVSAWVFYPGAKPRQKGFSKPLLAALMGFLGAFGASYLGQFNDLFQSGQMLEWLSAIIASSLAACFYTAFSK